MSEQTTVEIPIEQFDVTILPGHARKVGTPQFRDAVVAFFAAELKPSADWVQVGVDERVIRVAWRTKGGTFDPLDQAIDRLKGGDYQRGVQLLRLLARARPGDVTVNYNLG